LNLVTTGSAASSTIAGTFPAPVRPLPRYAQPTAGSTPPPCLLMPAAVSASRLATGWMVTDTLLPICQGQRLGLFAGSGVGKSTFLGSLAAGLEADRVVIALIGERSREVNEFVRNILPQSIMSKTVVVAATASEPPGAKKRAAYCAITAAEHFRDEGHNVLFLFDSITRFAEAHRETAHSWQEKPPP
jgi:flagellum-specific ATP synthase